MTGPISMLPKWVWDLIADVIEYEDVHPAVDPGNACLARALDRVPEDVMSAVEVVRAYRRQPAEPDVVCRTHNGPLGDPPCRPGCTGGVPSP